MKKIFALLIASGFILNSCCNEDFILPGYDFFDYAIDLTGSIDTGCSGAIYTTEGATSDGHGCIGTPLHNRWFKFQAPYTSIYITVLVGAAEGTQLNSVATLVGPDGVTEFSCQYYESEDDDLYVSGFGLTVGEWYYLGVDVDDSAEVGTFSVCIATD